MRRRIEAELPMEEAMLEEAMHEWRERLKLAEALVLGNVLAPSEQSEDGEQPGPEDDGHAV